MRRALGGSFIMVGSCSGAQLESSLVLMGVLWGKLQARAWVGSVECGERGAGTEARGKVPSDGNPKLEESWNDSLL